MDELLRAVTSHIADLRRCVPTLREYPEMHAVADEVAKAADELEAAALSAADPRPPDPAVVLNARRYEWLRVHSTQPAEGWSTHSNPESLDAIIDEAIAKEQP